MTKKISDFRFRTRILPAAVAMTAVLTLTGGAAFAKDGVDIQGNGTARPEAATSLTTTDGQTRIACALPGQIRKLGRSVTFLAPSRIVRIEHNACASRGGRPLSG